MTAPGYHFQDRAPEAGVQHSRSTGPADHVPLSVYYQRGYPYCAEGWPHVRGAQVVEAVRASAEGMLPSIACDSANNRAIPIPPISVIERLYLSLMGAPSFRMRTYLVAASVRQRTWSFLKMFPR